jgi:hypothetical protein
MAALVDPVFLENLMAWFPDLAVCTYFGDDAAASLRAVGWLERGKPFPTGTVERSVFEKLRELRADPWQPVVCVGPHACDLCVYEREARSVNNLFVPGPGFL